MLNIPYIPDISQARNIQHLQVWESEELLTTLRVSHLWPGDRMWPRMAMDAAQHKIINLLKTFWYYFAIMCCSVFNVCPKTTLLLPVWPRDAKKLHIPEHFDRILSYKVFHSASWCYKFVLNLRRTKMSQILFWSFKSNRRLACIFYFLLFKGARMMIYFFCMSNKRLRYFITLGFRYYYSVSADDETQ